MASRKEVTPALIVELAAYAELPLAKGRESVIQPTLEAWIKDANELSRKMSAEKYRDLIPATVFRHPDEPEEGG
ncbi:MAG TPA: hypothetical protein VHB46_16685 [Burkholderiales bacterium]|nr:hypothetical protein [Burkholderiales bacterium]